MENKQTNKQKLVGCLPQPECSGHTQEKKKNKLPQNPKNKARKISAASQNEVRRKYIILNFCKTLRLLTENSVL